MNDERKIQPQLKEAMIELARNVRNNRMALVTRAPEGMAVGNDIVGTNRSERDDWNGVFFDRGKYQKESSSLVRDSRGVIKNYRSIGDSNPNDHLVLASKKKLSNGFCPAIIFVHGNFPDHYESRMRKHKNMNMEVYLELNDDQLSLLSGLGEADGEILIDFLDACFPNMLNREEEEVKTKYSVDKSNVKIITS